jgi:hypothetical protein
VNGLADSFASALFYPEGNYNKRAHVRTKNRGECVNLNKKVLMGEISLVLIFEKRRVFVHETITLAPPGGS